MAEDQKIPIWGETTSTVPTWDDTEEVKKKVGEEVSESSVEPIISEEKPELKEAPNYMGLFDKKEDFKVADESGVSISFQEEVGKAASQAERPVEFLADINYIKKRLDALSKFKEFGRDVEILKKNLPLLNSQNIDNVKAQVSELEKRVRNSSILQTIGAPTGGVPIPVYSKFDRVLEIMI